MKYKYAYHYYNGDAGVNIYISDFHIAISNGSIYFPLWVIKIISVCQRAAHLCQLIETLVLLLHQLFSTKDEKWWEREKDNKLFEATSKRKKRCNSPNLNTCGIPRAYPTQSNNSSRSLALSIRMEVIFMVLVGRTQFILFPELIYSPDFFLSFSLLTWSKLSDDHRQRLGSGFLTPI